MAYDPLFIVNQTMDGTWQTFVPSLNAYSIVMQARTAVDFRVGQDAAGSAYFTVKSGEAITIETGNLLGRNIYLFAAPGVVIEILSLTA